LSLSLFLAARQDTLAALAGALAFAAAFLLTPTAERGGPPLSKALYAAGGELLGAQAALDGQWRLDVSAAPSPRYVAALVEYEDGRFYGHAGFDPLAIARAAAQNARSGRVVSGGSTITLQTARLSRPPGPRDLGAKLAELWLAVRLELGSSKAGILRRYADLAPYGANVVGLESAGFRWFGRPPSDLTWAEAATLAVLPNSPGLIHPGRSRDELRRKRDALLDRLAAAGSLSPTDLSAALAEPLPEAPRPMPNLAPHLLSKVGPGRTASTLDAALQARANAVAARHAARLGRYGVGNLAVVILRVGDGTVAAYVGNAPPGPGTAAPWVACAAAPRSSGSILKPFLYASMLDSGELSPGRLVPDIPTRVGSYSPENNLKTYAGAVRADEALARSLNVPFVRRRRGDGVERFASLLKRLGFSTLVRAPADYGLPLILGGAEATLADAAAAYASLARSALADDRPVAVARARWRAPEEGQGGGALPASRGERSVPFSAGAAWLTLEALVEVARPGEEASWQEYASSRRVAWKTGTSFGSRDAWAIGVTPDWAVAVWAGNASGEGRPELKGTDAAAPLLFDLFEALPRADWFPAPAASLRYETVCARSGYVAGPDCAETARVLVPAAASADSACPYCRLVHLSPDRAYRVRPESAGGAELTSERRFCLPPAIEWYYARSSLGYEPLPPWAPGSEGDRGLELEFIAPEEGSMLFVPIELDGSPGRTVFRAVHRDPDARLFWHLDGDYLGETRGDHRMDSRPAPGRHELLVMDESGLSVTRRFGVFERD